MSERCKSSGLRNLVLAAAVALAGPALAQPKDAPVATLTSVSVEGFASLLQDQGFKAEQVQGRYVPLVFTGMAGRQVSVGFYDCTAGACAAIQYRLIFRKDDDLTLDLANAWNVRKRFAKAHVATDGRLILEWDYDLSGGVSSAALRQSVQRFQQMVGLFDQFMRERAEAAAAARGQRPQAPARSAERPA